MSDASIDLAQDWKEHGLRIIRSGELDTNTPQTGGMTRAEAISHARVGASVADSPAASRSASKSACD